MKYRYWSGAFPATAATFRPDRSVHLDALTEHVSSQSSALISG